MVYQLKDGVEERPEETAAQKQKEEAANMYDTFDMRVDRHWSEKKVEPYYIILLFIKSGSIVTQGCSHRYSIVTDFLAALPLLRAMGSGLP